MPLGKGLTGSHCSCPTTIPLASNFWLMSRGGTMGVNLTFFLSETAIPTFSASSLAFLAAAAISLPDGIFLGWAHAGDASTQQATPRARPNIQRFIRDLLPLERPAAG